MPDPLAGLPRRFCAHPRPRDSSGYPAAHSKSTALMERSRGTEDRRPGLDDLMARQFFALLRIIRHARRCLMRHECPRSSAP
jgi:hypothetical protein